MKKTVKFAHAEKKRLIAALANELNPVDLAQLVAKTGVGHGDFTKEREKMFAHLSAEEITKDVLALAAKRRKNRK